jgi:hypothetical protein
MIKEQKEIIEMKNDGHDAERFQSLLKKVVSVSKEELKKEDKRQAKEKKKG